MSLRLSLRLRVLRLHLSSLKEMAEPTETPNSPNSSEDPIKRLFREKAEAFSFFQKKTQVSV